MHVGIGLALKSNVAVGSASHHETRQPLNDIPEIEADKQGFLHLAGVYALMKYEIGSKPCLYRMISQLTGNRLNLFSEYYKSS